MTNIQEINRRYQNLTSRDIRCFLINHGTLFDLFRKKQALDVFLKEVGEHDKYASSFRVVLNYLTFEYANCPLPLSNAYFYRNDRLKRIRSFSSALIQIYPSWSETIEEIVNLITSLSSCDDNPLLENIESNVGLEGISLVLINPDYTHAVIEMCEAYGIHIDVSVPDVPSAPNNKGVFCGCAKFFPYSAFWSPEYSNLHLVRFAWFPDYLKKFPDIYGGLGTIETPKLVIERKPSLPAQEVEIESSNPIEDFDDSFFEYYGREKKGQFYQGYDDIEANLVILKGGKFVFLPSDEDYKHHCIVNLDAEPVSKKLPISEFDENTALLLRERGAGDYVVEVADQIMRDQAGAVRGHQKKWKDALREKIDSLGAPTVSDMLRNRGCARATYQNLRNWASLRTIRPEDDGDFTALLKFLEMESEVQAIMKSMSLIRRAHIKAGHFVSSQLKGLVESDKNIRGILSDGYRIYRTEDSGKVGVYVFERVYDKIFPVPYTEIGKLKNMEETLYG